MQPNNFLSQNSMPTLQPLLKQFHPVIQGFNNKSEDPKPNYSYIGLISMAILSTKEKKMVLADIYQWIQDHYTYFLTRGPGWRNSIRHNLSLNDCFIKIGRSSNGKGHYWGIHPANFEDFKKGDFRRRRAQRKVRKALGLICTDEDDSISLSPIHSPKLSVWSTNSQNGLLNNMMSTNSVFEINSIINKYLENDKPFSVNALFFPYVWSTCTAENCKPKFITPISNTKKFDIDSILNPLTENIPLKNILYNEIISQKSFQNLPHEMNLIKPTFTSNFLVHGTFNTWNPLTLINWRENQIDQSD